MTDRIFNLIVGSLLHDIGKVVYRAGADSRSHPVSGMEYVKKYTDEKDILNCIRYHHGQDIAGSGQQIDSPAYIVYIADNISAGIDRREVEGEAGKSVHFDKEVPLASIFNLLNGNNGEEIFKPVKLSRKGEINFPEARSASKISQSNYVQLLQGIQEGMANIKIEPDYINSILEICEAHLTFVPSSTITKQTSDISLFDHSKTTAAIASCIYLYLNEKEIKDYKAHLLQKEKDFYGEKAFLMMACDISGIQKFIYTIPSKGAMKSLRARSFYLEILLEHVVDLLLKEAGCSRANLIYTGGGHAYILLPNSLEVQSSIERVFHQVNKWLTKRFGTSLYIAEAFQECSANELMNKPLDKAPYQRIYINLSHKLSHAKLQRYSPEEIRIMNSKEKHQNEGRECKVCGAVDDLSKEENICKMCKGFIDVSNDLIKGESVLLVTNKKLDIVNTLPLPGLDDMDCFICPLSMEKAKEYLINSKEYVVGIYGKNRMYTGLKLFTKIWMGDYYLKSIDNEYDNEAIATFEEMADKSKGIKRLAVLRADVDNLGKAFMSGFLRPGETDVEKKFRYLTLSRTASLSRMLSLFFKLNINKIMEKSQDSGNIHFSMQKRKEDSGRCLTIVYSGGDDVFIVGAWDEVIEAAIDIRRAFQKFSGGTLHLSAGICINSYSYPVYLMADETAELEEAAKKMDGKDSIALFGSEFNPKKGQIEVSHIYKWKEFEDLVIGEKLKTLQEYFESADNVGSTLLYKFLDYIRGAEDDKINLARFAYQLGRLQPDPKAEIEKQQMYTVFCQKMYRWFIDKEERRQLLTAIYIMVYLGRKSEQLEEGLKNG